MDVINSTPIGPGPTSTTPTGNASLGKDEFMKLLLTQMANQDPTEPQSNEEMVAQLAQFAALETQQAVATQLEGLLMAQAAANQMAAVDLVGKDVTFESDTVALDGAKAETLTFDLAAPADSITVVITDENGREVRREVLDGPFSGDDVDYVWDGRDSNGDQMKDTTFSVSVTAQTGEQEPVDARILKRSTVAGISYDDGPPMLLFDGGTTMGMNDVIEVWDHDDQ